MTGEIKLDSDMFYKSELYSECAFLTNSFVQGHFGRNNLMDHELRLEGYISHVKFVKIPGLEILLLAVIRGKDLNHSFGNVGFRGALRHSAGLYRARRRSADDDPVRAGKHAEAGNG